LNISAAVLLAFKNSSDITLLIILLFSKSNSEAPGFVSVKSSNNLFTPLYLVLINA